MPKDKCDKKSNSCSGNCPCSGENMFKIWVFVGILIGLIWYFVQ